MEQRPTDDSRPVAERPGRARRWWLDRSIRVKGMIVIAMPLLGLIGVAATGLVLGTKERDQRRVAVMELNLVMASSAVLADVVNAETGVRGFAATGGDPVYLEPYDLTLTRIDDELATLRRAATAFGADDTFARVDATTLDVLDQMAALRTAVANGASIEELARARRDEKSTMDRLRSEVALLSEGPATSLVRHRDEITDVETTIKALNLVGVVVALLGGLAGVALFTSGVARRVVAAEANAVRLGRGLPVQPVTASGDELGRLADALSETEVLLATRARELTAARDAALRANEAKNAFLSHTSHELRTPLNSILGFTQLLEMSDLDAEDRDSVTRILSAGRHLLVLINELIDIARIESGDLNMSVEPVAVMPLIQQVVDLLRPLAAVRSIVVMARWPQPRLSVQADHQRLTQVLVNLLSNAVKYSGRGGVITIGCRADDVDLVRVIVSDTGRGITADDLERIFVPFERLVGEQAAVEGTGIGLPLAKALTEAMGGTLTAASTVGVGSEFTVTLARAPDVELGADEHSHLPARPSSVDDERAPLHVVYIEDNPANVEVVDRYLRSRPRTRLEAFAAGRAGLDSIRDDAPDVILLDLHLPGMSGGEVLAELRADPTTIGVPVVILSADASPGVVRRLMAGGAVAFLTKPIDLVELGGLLDALAPTDDSGRLPLVPT